MNVVRLKAFEFTLHLPSSHSVLCYVIQGLSILSPVRPMEIHRPKGITESDRERTGNMKTL